MSMNVTAFVLAVLTLLALPGPTNTLLAASGASIGVRGSLKLLPAEIGGYLVAILALDLMVVPLMAGHSWAVMVVKLAASLWLAHCAVRLWRDAGEGFRAAPRPISFGQVFVTTLVNPKGLIFALAIFPPVPLADLAPWLAAFSCLVLLVGIGWIVIGRVIAESVGALATPQRIWRGAALGLAAFATVIAGSVLFTAP